MSSEPSKQKLAAADRAYESGDYERALELYRKAIESDRHFADAWHGAGLCLWALRHFDEALRSFNQALQHNPHLTLAALDKAALLTDDLAEHRAALRVCDKILLKPMESSDAADARFIAARAHFRLGNDAAAMEMIEQALELRPRDLEILLWKGHAQFETGDYEAARQTYELALQVEPDDAQAHYDYGLVLEKLGETRAADAEFQRAHDLDPATYRLPVRISETDITRVVAEVLDELPRQFQQVIKDVPILIEEFPSRDLVISSGLTPQILGLFTGNIHQHRLSGAPQPTAIILYKRNLEKIASTKADLEHEIRITLLHEIAHYLGFDEQDMEDLGLQ
jgi:predicted Zn-dependent protease with MMP-like domain/Flp pilus assembly protein TadD